MEVTPLTGAELQGALPALADLRIRVFRQWPYLYDGSLAYEEKYLAKFAAAPDALVVVAKNEAGDIIGASTASPLLGHADAFARPFADHGYDPARVFYFGESVLLPDYRGHGIGHRFFDARETHASASGAFDIAAFCAVIRNEDDPRKPAGYTALDPFWIKRGFHKKDGMTTTLGWKEPGTDGETGHTMQFWIKTL